MHFPRTLALAFGLSILGSGPAVAEGRLDEVRDQIDGHSWGSQAFGNASPRYDSADCDHRDNPFWAESIGPFLGMVLASPWWGPHVALDDSFADEALFPRYPYQDGTSGALSFDSHPPAGSRPWGGRFTAEYGTDLSGLTRIGGHYLIDTRSRFGIDTEFNSWREERPLGDDAMWTGDFNVVYRFAQSERVQFRSGLGANWLEDHGRGELGFNFTYGVDLYPAQPWVLSSTIDAGTLGDAGTFHVRSTAGVLLKNLEFFGGFDYRRIGSADLPGLITGIRLSF